MEEEAMAAVMAGWFVVAAAMAGIRWFAVFAAA